VILLPQIGEKPISGDRKDSSSSSLSTDELQNTKLYTSSILDADLFPGPHSAQNDKTEQLEYVHLIDIQMLSFASVRARKKGNW